MSSAHAPAQDGAPRCCDVWYQNLAGSHPLRQARDTEDSLMDQALRDGPEPANLRLAQNAAQGFAQAEKI